MDVFYKIAKNTKKVDKNFKEAMSSRYRTVPSAIWEMFSEFLIFYRFLSANIAQGNQ